MTTEQPAWVLARKSYGDNGLLVEFLTSEWGRCSAVVRGAHRKKRGGTLASLLQPFQPLLVTLIGRGELKTVRQVEAPVPGYHLQGEALIHGLYVNELLIRVLPRFDALPQLFLAYGVAAEQLGTDASESTLRRFELVLLSELGYRLNLQADENGEAIQGHLRYCFEAERGLCAAIARPGASEPMAFTGDQLLRLQHWCDEGLELMQDDLIALKRLTRVAMTQLTSGRTLHTQALVRNLRSHQRN